MKWHSLFFFGPYKGLGKQIYKKAVQYTLYVHVVSIWSSIPFTYSKLTLIVLQAPGQGGRSVVIERKLIIPHMLQKEHL